MYRIPAVHPTQKQHIQSLENLAQMDRIPTGHLAPNQIETLKNRIHMTATVEMDHHHGHVRNPTDPLTMTAILRLQTDPEVISVLHPPRPLPATVLEQSQSPETASVLHPSRPLPAAMVDRKLHPHHAVDAPQSQPACGSPCPTTGAIDPPRLHARLRDESQATERSTSTTSSKTNSSPC